MQTDSLFNFISPDPVGSTTPLETEIEAEATMVISESTHKNLWVVEACASFFDHGCAALHLLRGEIEHSWGYLGQCAVSG